MILSHWDNLCEVDEGLGLSVSDKQVGIVYIHLDYLGDYSKRFRNS